MSKVQASSDLSTIDESDIKKYVTLVLQDIVDKVNGKLELGVNVSGKVLSFTFAAANSDTSVAHGLGRVPVGYLLAGSSASMSVYNGSIANTASSLTIRSSTAGTASIYVF